MDNKKKDTVTGTQKTLMVAILFCVLATIFGFCSLTFWPEMLPELDRNLTPPFTDSVAAMGIIFCVIFFFSGSENSGN
jgi:type IV secretory pathway VirB2 component (pilin)